MASSISNPSATFSTDDVIKILVATDIHLGYGEKHPVKAEDTFTTFEEILQIAVQQDVDMVLLGGDLYHENKPSRSTEKKCISILRKYVLGDRPINLHLVSDPNVNFSHCDETDRNVNYANPNMNIALPIFSIHGNHDDPVGLGGLSAMDNLHATGLVNYFGRISNLKEITVTPLLLCKGQTRLALYGLSSVKDERLYRLFRENKVQMMRPEEETDEWFNLLTLHQNRAKHGSSNYIPEHYLDGFMDLVIWGHEHECRLKPEEMYFGDDKHFFISQPGSSVATSMCEAEAKQKCVGILEIRGKTFKMTAIPLKTVRPLIFKTICIEDELNAAELRHLPEKKLAARINLFLKNYVETILAEEVPPLLTNHPQQPVLPQVRVRVEYVDEKHQLATGLFGNQFHDKVANPAEILLFRKRIEKTEKETGVEVEGDLLESIFDRHLSTCTSMEDLIAQYFQQADGGNQLKLLGIKSIGAAVKAYIDKDDKDAIRLIVENQVAKITKALIEADLHDEEVDEELERFRERRTKDAAAEEREANAALNDQECRKLATQSRKDNFEDEINEDDDDNDEPNAWMSSSMTGRGSGRGRGRANTRANTTRGSGRGKYSAAKDDNDEVKPKSGRGSRGGRAASRPSPAKVTQGRGGRQKAVVVDQPSVSQMFAKQSQALSKKRPIHYLSDSD